MAPWIAAPIMLLFPFGDPVRHRWKACRLGPGALFGNCPSLNEHTDGVVEVGRAPRGDSLQWHHAGPNRTGSTDGSNSDVDEHYEYRLALETAVTAETTELLEIGPRTYRELLAVGARERVNSAVAVLRATRALVRRNKSCEI